MTILRAFVLSALCATLSAAANAEPTEIVVRVLAKDAKFIGTDTGGMQIKLADADTGEILAEGITTGINGPTPRIMTDPRARRDVLSDGTTGKFSAVLDLQTPRHIVVTAFGPLSAKESAGSVSSTQWVLPGKPVNGGDGWVLELPGFAITLMEPLPAEMALKDASQIPLKAKITMQCGCAITPGGFWDSNKIQIAALVERGGKTSSTVPLSYAGQPSTFTGNIAIAEAGEYTIDLYAYDPSNGNTGVNRISLHVR